MPQKLRALFALDAPKTNLIVEDMYPCNQTKRFDCTATDTATTSSEVSLNDQGPHVKGARGVPPSRVEDSVQSTPDTKPTWPQDRNGLFHLDVASNQKPALDFVPFVAETDRDLLSAACSFVQISIQQSPIVQAGW